jgi:flavin reductase (DIM6/NTAB) family NADH-FMN oxidoreductase RutF
MASMEINPKDLQSRQIYKLMTASIVPRPIAWVSTVDKDGNPNLAPFSYFTAASDNPPMIIFCSGIRSADGEPKDTYKNIKAMGEYVINFTNKATADAMNITATEVESDVNEFERANLSAVPSKIVNVPRVKESPISFECKLSQIVTISDKPGGGHIIIGEIVYMHFDDAVYQEGDYIDIEAYQPIGRLMGNQYAHINDLFTLQRPPSEIKRT